MYERAVVRVRSSKAGYEVGKGTATQVPATTTPQISLWAAAPTGVEEALPHSSGCDSWTSWPVPAPRGYPAGITGPGRLWTISQTSTAGPFSSVLPAPAS